MDRTATKNQLFNIVDTVDQKISPFFTQKLPALPDNIREILAKITPYLIIVSLAISGVAFLALLGYIPVTSPFVVMYGSMGSNLAVSGGILAIIFLGAQLLLQALAITGLLKFQRQGWNFLFLSALISLISDLLSLNIFNLVISFLISFYLLYQIKPYFRQ